MAVEECRLRRRIAATEFHIKRIRIASRRNTNPCLTFLDARECTRRSRGSEHCAFRSHSRHSAYGARRRGSLGKFRTSPLQLAHWAGDRRDGDHFYIDLVFYHAVLKCFVLVDLKVGKLTHADLGQLQLYVNYYDLERTAPDDNPTLGLILCSDKNDTVVKYTLRKNQ